MTFYESRVKRTTWNAVPPAFAVVDDCDEQDLLRRGQLQWQFASLVADERDGVFDDLLGNALILSCTESLIKFADINQPISVQTKLRLCRKYPADRVVDPGLLNLSGCNSLLYSDESLFDIWWIQDYVRACFDRSNRSLTVGIMGNDPAHVHCICENDPSEFHFTPQHACEHL